MTTTPKKKTSTKSTAAKSSAKGTSKSAASGAKKTPKKKARRKKKDGGKGLLLAFLAGLLLASAGFWFLRGVTLPEPAETRGQIAQVESTKAPPEKQTAAVTDRKASEPRKPAQSKAVEKDSTKSSPPPQAQSAQPPSRPPDKTADAAEDQRETARNNAIASALIDLQSLPYEESLTVTLDDRIRQIDYALMQAAWFEKLPARALRLALIEDRLEGVEPYQYQTIDILPGQKSGPFLEALRDCLQAWAEGAVFKATERGTGKERWTISVNGVETHSLRLYPGKAEFPPLPGAREDTRIPDGSAVAPPAGEAFAHARPRPRRAGEVPKLTIVIDDLGASRSAINKLLALNYPVTFAFWPHGAHTREGAAAAHAKGREILVHLPMEPLGYPKVQPGPNVLLTSMDKSVIRRITEAGIAAVPFASGLNNHMGSRFTQFAPGVDAVLGVLRERGLFMLDSLTHNRSVFALQARRLGVEHYRRNVFLDVEHPRAKVLDALRKAEKIALLTGQAVAIGHPLPETLAALQDWQHRRNKEVRIVRLRDLAQD